jgi:hypothetical protein
LDREQPIPDPWLEAGTIASTINNAWSSRKLSACDFVPRVGPVGAEPAAEEDDLARFDRMFPASGGES